MAGTKFYQGCERYTLLRFVWQKKLFLITSFNDFQVRANQDIWWNETD